MLYSSVLTVLLCQCILFSSGSLCVRKVVVRLPRQNDIGLIFDLTVSNTPTNGKKEMLEFYVRSDGLCTLNISQERALCGFSRIFGGDFGNIESGQTETVSLVWPTVSLYNRVGFCPIVIISSNARNQETNLKQLLYFDTRFETLDPERHSLRNHRDYRDCHNWDKDYLKNCTPVNCEERYFGKRSFYNFKTEQCEPVPACAHSNMYYDMHANECMDRNDFVTESDLEQLRQGKYDDNYLGLQSKIKVKPMKLPAQVQKTAQTSKVPQKQKHVFAAMQHNATKKSKKESPNARRTLEDFQYCLGGWSTNINGGGRKKKNSLRHLILDWLTPLKSFGSSVSNNAYEQDLYAGLDENAAATSKKNDDNDEEEDKEPSDDKKEKPENAGKSGAKAMDSVMGRIGDLIGGLFIVLVTIGIYLLICIAIFLIVSWMAHRSQLKRTRSAVSYLLTPRHSDDRFSVITKSSLLSQRN